MEKGERFKKDPSCNTLLLDRTHGVTGIVGHGS